MTQKCEKCRRTVQKKPVIEMPPKEPLKIELPDRDTSEVRRSLIGKTLRIRFRPPVE